MIASLVKARRKYSCTFCINVNETLEKYIETLKTDTLGENEPSGTIIEKEIENLQLILSEKEIEIEKLDRSKAVNEKLKEDMKLEIENLKNEKQVQPNLIKLKKEELLRLLSNMRKKTVITN